MPLYLQLAALRRSRIQDGTITKRLPSVNKPSQEHAVSYTAAERALRDERPAQVRYKACPPRPARSDGGSGVR